MNMDCLYGREKILSSEAAEKGAKSLRKKLESNALGMDVLPNQYDQFPGELEEQDYISYCRFLKSSNGGKVLKMLEEEDAAEYIEL